MPATKTSTFAAMGRALRHPNYRLFFFGQGTSLIGTWLTRIATSWLVFRLTHSALLLGVVGFAGQLPTFLLAPIAGVLIDRWNRHRVLVVTQILAMIQSALLAYFALTGTITVVHVLALSVFQGLVNAFDTPARQSFVVEMVDAREDLPNAIALNSSMVNGARLLGPSVAGVLIAAFGEGWCFAIDAISYLAVIATLLAMHITPRLRAPKTTRVWTELREGFAYARAFAPIRALLLLTALVSFTGVPYSVLMPIFASNVLHGGPHTLGLLMAASGIGAVTGALWLASRRSVLGLGRTMSIAGFVFGAALIALAVSRTVWLSTAMMIFTGGGMMVQLASANTLIQTLVEEDKRGRVMSFYTMAFFGMVPFGSLVGGYLGDRLGAPTTVLLGGVATLLGVAVFVRKLPALRREVRPIYVGLGILPAIAEGLKQATEMKPEE